MTRNSVEQQMLNVGPVIKELGTRERESGVGE